MKGKSKAVNIRLSQIGKLLDGKPVLVMKGLHIVCQEIRRRKMPKGRKDN